MLLKQTPDLALYEVSAYASEDRSPLHEAVEQGSKAVAELLLANKADVNAKDGEKYSPLHRAAAKGHKEMVALLLAYRADVNIKHECMKYVNGSASLLKKWGRPDSGNTPLHYAAFYGHKDVLELLLAKGADVNAKEDDDKTPLHFAAIKGRKEAVKLLLAKGADVNAKEDTGETPLHYAAIFGYRDVAELLLANKADVSAKNRNGETPWKLASSGEGDLGGRVSTECKDVAECLREHGGHE